MVSGLLVHGEIALVRKVIVETDLLETVFEGGRDISIHDAIALSFNEDRHERATGLFEAAYERPNGKARARNGF